MPTPRPDAFFQGYEYLAAGDAATADSIAIPLTALPGLTAAEAAEANGDGRKVVFELTKAAYNKYAAMATADRPTRLVLARANPTGNADGTVNLAFTVTNTLNIDSSDLATDT